jgi:signal-transduction protein with cAMP-binding, CBS, and nucleotidyltransferase domain
MMTLIDRLFALRTSPPFDQLRESELVLIAAAVRPKTFEAGEVIGEAGRPLRHLYVNIDGGAVMGPGTEAPRVFGAVSLLFGTPLDQSIRAGTEGATYLLVRRAHFHTILNECPGLIVGLLRDGHRNGSRAA